MMCFAVILCSVISFESSNLYHLQLHDRHLSYCLSLFSNSLSVWIPNAFSFVHCRFLLLIVCIFYNICEFYHSLMSKCFPVIITFFAPCHYLNCFLFYRCLLQCYDIFYNTTQYSTIESSFALWFLWWLEDQLLELPCIFHIYLENFRITADWSVFLLAHVRIDHYTKSSTSNIRFLCLIKS